MVLRKPYKFLIKHFRFIHLLLAVMSSYLLTRTNSLISFFNDYINNTETLIGAGTSNEYFTVLMIIFCVGILIGSVIILFIMKMKDKPILFYIINIIAYVIITVIYLYDNSIIQKLELSTIDIRTIKLASDFTLICFLIQTLSTIILFVRGIGFSIKKFNFEQDLKFDIDERDNEEFEFDVDIDKNKIKRKINKRIRDFKYNYHENKFLINMAMLILLLIIGLIIFLNIKVFNKIYKENNLITTTEFSYTITDSYLINTSYKNKKITNNYLLVAKMKIKANSNDLKVFEPARVLLHIGKVRYNPTTKYKDDVIDLGNVYDGEKISNEFSEYLLVFEIPKKYINKKKILSYSDPYSSVYKTKLSSEKFNKKDSAKAKFPETIKLNSELISNVEFKINSYTITDRVKSEYTFCETSKNCYTSYEYIVPTLTDNYTKYIFKIDSTINFNGQQLTNFKDISDIIETFGTIKYTLDGEEKEMKTKIKEVSPRKGRRSGIYYFEIYKEIKSATNISLILNIRNSKYEYVLRG